MNVRCRGGDERTVLPLSAPVLLAGGGGVGSAGKRGEPG